MGLRPTPGRIPDHGPGDPWNPLPVLGTIARNAPDVALLFHALAGPDPRDPLSIQEPWPLPPTLDDFDPSRVRDRLELGSRRAARGTGGHGRARGGARGAGGARLHRRGRRARLQRRGRVLRGAARRELRRRLRIDRRRPQADAARERPLRPAPGGVPGRGSPRAARRAVHAHARVPHPLRLLRRPDHAGGAVQRRHRVPDGDRRNADGLLHRVVPLVQPDHGHRASRARPCRRA